MGGAAVMALSKNFKLVIGIVIVILVISGITAAALNAPSKNKKPVAGQVTIVIERSLGVYTISLNNVNEETGAFPASQFPYNFTTTAGDEIELRGTAKDGYRWSGWKIIIGDSSRFVAGTSLTFLSDNPLYMDSKTNTITIRPECLRLNPTPSPSPSPSPSPHPTPTPNPDSQLVSVRTLEYR
jgi:hypothetical protein